jgi:hypothetical protein
MTPDKFTVDAQSVLDDLWAKQLIPFQLTAHQVESLGHEEYIVRFFDSRLRSVDVSWKTPRLLQECSQSCYPGSRSKVERALKNKERP